MSRRRNATLPAMAVLVGLAGLAVPAAAQDGATGSPPERIDLTITAPRSSSADAECRRRAEIAVVSGEIVVCGTAPVEDQRITSREEAQQRYAEATQGRTTPDVAGPGIFRGPATVGGICVPGIFNCPKPPAVLVDVRALPQAPPGSDADRIGRGLMPLGESESAGVARQISAAQRAELGLPEPEAGGGTASPAESAGPAVPQ